MSDYVRMRKSTMDSIAQAIQEKDGSTEKITGAEMPDRIRALGGSGVVLSDWGNVQLRTLNGLGTADATINLPRAWRLTQLCDRSIDSTGEYSNITVEHLTINCPNAVESLTRMLAANQVYAESKLTHLTLNVDTSVATEAVAAFYACNKLSVIDGTPLDLSGMTADSKVNQMFHMCYKLAEVRFKGTLKVSLSLIKAQQITKESIDSVVSCLSDDTSGKWVSFNEKRINSLYETSEGAADGSSSAEWQTVVDRKPNWTFTLGA